MTRNEVVFCDVDEKISFRVLLEGVVLAELGDDLLNEEAKGREGGELARRGGKQSWKGRGRTFRAGGDIASA